MILRYLSFIFLYALLQLPSSSRGVSFPVSGYAAGAAPGAQLLKTRGLQQAVHPAVSEDSPQSIPVPPNASKCPEGCTKNGTCNEELARCDCPRHLSGPKCNIEEDTATVCSKYGHSPATCTKVDPGACINSCNFRGTCIGGWCHCLPGYYGADCSLSLDDKGKPELLAGQQYVPRASGPRIYVYELPPSLNTWHNLDRVDRPLYALFWQRLLSAGVRVATPEAADYFFIPIKLRLSYDSELLKKAVAYVRQTWPYWNVTYGHRHVLMHTGDWGRDDLTDDAKMLTRNCTWLTHWGLAVDHEPARWKAAHRPGRDIVIPMMLPGSFLNALHIERSPLNPYVNVHRNRTRTLFFAGRFCTNRKEPLINTWPNCAPVLNAPDTFSAATRQRVFYYHQNRTNYKIVSKTRTYQRDLVTSQYCLTPTGSGSGKRVVVVSLMGCVPVTVTDGVLQPFEPEIHWDQFALDVREKDIPNMHKILESLSPSQLAEYQIRLHCAALHLMWSSLYGAVVGEDGRYDAFETTLQILRMRRKYPHLSAEEYAFNDEFFQKFMDCELGPLPPTAGVAAGLSASGGALQEAGAAAGGLGLAGKLPSEVLEAMNAAEQDTNDGDGSGSGSVRGGGAGSGSGPGSKPAGSAGSKPGKSAGVRVGKGKARSPPPALSEPVSVAGKAMRRVKKKKGAKDVVEEVVPVLCAATDASGDIPQCNKCVRRRGKLVNPGGAICCNTRDLARCPRLWD